MSDLTTRQGQVLSFIEAYVGERGYAPSIREIGNGVGLTSTSSVVHVLDVLEARGQIRRGAWIPRGLALADTPMARARTVIQQLLDEPTSEEAREAARRWLDA